jgi:hypothetical protein
MIRATSGGLQGAVSGLVATGAMSAVMLAAQRLGLVGKLPPRKIVQRWLAAHGVPWHRRRGQHGVATVSHFAFGASAGWVFGLLARALGLRRPTGLALGGAYGAAVWAVAYGLVLPAAGLMPRPEQDRPGRQGVMAGAHLIYGAVLGGLAAPRK